MIKLKSILLEELQKRADEAIILEEIKTFQEIADPFYSYKYKLIKDNEWEFNDKYGNILGVKYMPDLKYFESYYIMDDIKGNKIKVFDYETNKEYLDPTSFQGGSDEHRSDTICKILLDEVLPKYLLNVKPSIVKLHPLNDYRYKIFMKCAEICKEKHPNIKIKPVGKEIHLTNG
jgi:hypothetical protein